MVALGVRLTSGRNFFIYFSVITNKCTINIIQVYITTASLFNLYSYMFQKFLVIIRDLQSMSC